VGLFWDYHMDMTLSLMNVTAIYPAIHSGSRLKAQREVIKMLLGDEPFEEFIEIESGKISKRSRLKKPLHILP